jgi:tetratricopeptide (TPR) repeat protein
MASSIGLQPSLNVTAEAVERSRRNVMKKLIVIAAIALQAAFPVFAQEQPAQPATQPAAQPQTAAQYYANAQQLAAQAEIAYPTAFLDLPLWDSAVANAATAADLEPSNLTYLRYLAELYTTTQWWIRAYDTWKLLEAKVTLDETSKTQAARSAAKLGYLAMQRGAKAEAVTYLQESLRWKEDMAVRSLLQRAQN